MAADEMPNRAGTRTPRLVVVAGYGLGRSFPLTKHTTTIGRDPKADIVMPYSTVSFHHASLTFADGEVVVQDLGSRNGTFVGIDKVKRRALVEGDLLAIGESQVLRLTYLAAEPSPTVVDRPPYSADPVGNVPRLLDRLRVERSLTHYPDTPLVLAFIRLDVLREGGDESADVELVMRQLGVAICAELSPQDVCARSGDHEHLALVQSSLKEAEQLVDRVRIRVAKRLERTTWRERPYGLTVALLPLGNLLALSPSEILATASARAHAGMVDLLNRTVALDTLHVGAAR